MNKDLAVRGDTLAKFEGVDDKWLEAIPAFIYSQRSKETRRAYQFGLKDFFTFTDKHPKEITQSDTIRYQLHLETRELANATINLRLASISSYYQFLKARGVTRDNPVDGIKRKECSAYAKATWLSEDQTRELLEILDKETVKGKRDYALILTMLLTGIRRAEVSNLKYGDFERRGDKIYLVYIPKGGREIARDIPNRVWKAIESYLEASDRKLTKDSPIFIATHNKGDYLRDYYGVKIPEEETPLTEESIRQIIEAYADKILGDDHNITPHSLRHTSGTLLRRAGRSIEEVQSFLKHSQVETTRRYLHVVEAMDSELGEDIARLLNL